MLEMRKCFKKLHNVNGSDCDVEKLKAFSLKAWGHLFPFNISIACNSKEAMKKLVAPIS